MTRFGAENVHIVSFIGSFAMRRKTEKWLSEVLRIAEIGLGWDNVHFTWDRTGENGKGPVAEWLKLTHFVDDKDSCLWSVYEDPAGNAGASIRRFEGTLYQFSHNGVPKKPCRSYTWNGRCKYGIRCKYKHPGWLTAKRWPEGDTPPSCVVPVDNWEELIAHLFADEGRALQP